jgi:hypothetical protein
MATTIGDATSRVRNVLKAVKEDPFMTDRFLYSMIMKYAKLLIAREDSKGNMKQYTSMFSVIPCIELIEVDKIEACCLGVRTGCTFRRSKDKLPEFVDGGKGPIIRSVTTIDQSQRLEETYPSTYANITNMSNFKYHKSKHFWYLDGYIYIPDVDWEGVRMEALFDEDVSKFDCSEDASDCVQEQDRIMAVPEKLFAEVEQMVLKEILTTGQIPSDGADDSQNALR